jgi:hypothetical protein
MNDMTIQETPASRREGTIMGIKRNSKRFVVAAIAIAGLTGGAIAVHADTLADKFLPTATAPGTFPTIPATTCVIGTAPGSCEINLFAGPSTVTVNDVTNLGGTQTVDILGFGVNLSGTSSVTLAGGETSTIKVPVGTTLTIHFSTSLADPPELSFPSLPAGSVTKVGNDYSFTTTPEMVGTSVFQPGSNLDAPRQIAMGLVGALIVTPAGCATCAYAAVPYVGEAIVATTDLDLAFALDYKSGLHQFSMGYFGQSRNPDGGPRKVYHVVNGKSFPATTVIDVPAGQKMLLRYVNAGVTDKSMGMLGMRQTLLARNASLYTDSQSLIAPLVGPGETADVELTIPDVPAGQLYSLMDQGRQMNHGNNFGFGGALVFLEVWPYIPPPTNPVTGPVGPASEGGLPAGPLAPTTPGPQDPGTVGQEGGQPAPQSPPAPAPTGVPSGPPSEGGQPGQGTTGP